MRYQIDQIPPDSFCTLYLSSGHTIDARKDAKPCESTPSGWHAFFYETAATGRGRVKNWRINGPTIVALHVAGKA
jgi:hypothetical protein